MHPLLREGLPCLAVIPLRSRRTRPVDKGRGQEWHGRDPNLFVGQTSALSSAVELLADTRGDYAIVSVFQDTAKDHFPGWAARLLARSRPGI
jgi:hypothetical protein